MQLEIRNPPQKNAAVCLELISRNFFHSVENYWFSHQSDYFCHPIKKIVIFSARNTIFVIKMTTKFFCYFFVKSILKWIVFLHKMKIPLNLPLLSPVHFLQKILKKAPSKKKNEKQLYYTHIILLYYYNEISKAKNAMRIAK